MHCFYGRGEIDFPSTFTVQRVENRSSSHKISSIPILKLSSSLFESALSPFDLDRDSLPNETYLQFKEEKQHVPIPFFSFFHRTARAFCWDCSIGWVSCYRNVAT